MKNEDAESALRKLDEQYSKYKFMEANLVRKKLRCFLISFSYFIEEELPYIGAQVIV